MYTCTYSREYCKDNYMSQMERVARAKAAIIIGLYVWLCSMSAPMVEVTVEQIRDKDQISCFGTGVWGKRCLTLSNNTNPKGKYLASMPHKGAGNKSCVIPREEDWLRGLCSGLLITIVDWRPCKCRPKFWIAYSLKETITSSKSPKRNPK